MGTLGLVPRSEGLWVSWASRDIAYYQVPSKARIWKGPFGNALGTTSPSLSVTTEQYMGFGCNTYQDVPSHDMKAISDAEVNVLDAILSWAQAAAKCRSR